MSAYEILKALPEEHISVLVQGGVIPLPVTQKILLYEYYLACLEKLGRKYGQKKIAKAMTAKHYRVSAASVSRAIDFCEG